MSDPYRTGERGEFEPAVGCVLTTGNDLQAFAELPDCEHCEGTGKDLPPDWRSKPAEVAAVELDLWCTVDGCQRERPCPVHDHAAEPAPEPAGPGWEREAAAWEREAVEARRAAVGLAAERDAARAIVGQLNAELFEARAHRDMCATERDTALREVERLRVRRITGADRGGQGR